MLAHGQTLAVDAPSRADDLDDRASVLDRVERVLLEDEQVRCQALPNGAPSVLGINQARGLDRCRRERVAFAEP